MNRIIAVIFLSFLSPAMAGNTVIDSTPTYSYSVATSSSSANASLTTVAMQDNAGALLAIVADQITTGPVDRVISVKMEPLTNGALYVSSANTSGSMQLPNFQRIVWGKVENCINGTVLLAPENITGIQFFYGRILGSGLEKKFNFSYDSRDVSITCDNAEGDILFWAAAGPQGE